MVILVYLPPPFICGATETWLIGDVLCKIVLNVQVISFSLIPIFPWLRLPIQSIADFMVILVYLPPPFICGATETWFMGDVL